MKTLLSETEYIIEFSAGLGLLYSFTGKVPEHNVYNIDDCSEHETFGFILFTSYMALRYHIADVSRSKNLD